MTGHVRQAERHGTQGKQILYPLVVYAAIIHAEHVYSDKTTSQTCMWPLVCLVFKYSAPGHDALLAVLCEAPYEWEKQIVVHQDVESLIGRCAYM